MLKNFLQKSKPQEAQFVDKYYEELKNGNQNLKTKSHKTPFPLVINTKKPHIPRVKPHVTQAKSQKNPRFHR